MKNTVLAVEQFFGSQLRNPDKVLGDFFRPDTIASLPQRLKPTIDCIDKPEVGNQIFRISTFYSNYPKLVVIFT